MNIYTPFAYCITFISTGKRYYGVRYTEKEVAHPSQLWTTYFTSSKIIADLIEEYGEDSFTFKVRKTFKTRAEALSWENKFLTRINAAKHPEWLNGHNGGTTFCDTPESIQKAKDTKKRRLELGEISNSIPPNWKGKSRSVTMCNRLSKSKMGHEVTIETREKLRETNLGKKQSNSTIQKRAETLRLHKNAYGQKHWLFLSPTGKYYYTLGKRNDRLHELGLCEGTGFIKYVNKDLSPKKGKNIGWLFYEGEDKINEILNNISEDRIHYYE
jgi:hypothetical protein